MSNAPIVPFSTIEKVLIQGDLKSLSEDQRVSYYKNVCESVGLNPLTKPLEYIILNNKLTLYATKAAADQLRRVYGVSIRISSRSRADDCYMVTAEAADKSGRLDEAMGVVSIAGLKGDALANAMLKCETKAKRRVTLSICGLGLLDETEVEDIQHEHKTQPFNTDPFGKKQAALEQQVQENVKPIPVESSVAEPVQDESENLGAYVAKVGRDYKGKRLDEIDMFALDGFIKWLQNSAAKTGKALSGDAAELVQIGEAYLASKEVNNQGG